jgi:hypothetical protein
MPVLAMRLHSDQSAESVGSCVHDLKVRRIAAPSISAEVIDDTLEPLGDRHDLRSESSGRLKNESMRPNVASIPTEVSVSTRAETAGPSPASGRLVDLNLVPES